MTDVNDPPFVVLEHLKLAGIDTVRVVGISDDEQTCHSLAQAMADAGCRIWVVDLIGSAPEGEPRVERYVGAPHAAWLFNQGYSGTDLDAGKRLAQEGQ